jgi:hypothetical protein
MQTLYLGERSLELRNIAPLDRLVGRRMEPVGHIIDSIAGFLEEFRGPVHYRFQKADQRLCPGPNGVGRAFTFRCEEIKNPTVLVADGQKGSALQDESDARRPGPLSISTNDNLRSCENGVFIPKEAAGGLDAPDVLVGRYIYPKSGFYFGLFLLRRRKKVDPTAGTVTDAERRGSRGLMGFSEPLQHCRSPMVNWAMFSLVCPFAHQVVPTKKPDCSHHGSKS